MSAAESKQGSFGEFLLKLVGFIGRFVLALVLVAAIMLAIPRALGYQTFGVISGSMEPAIPTGSLVYVTYVDPATVDDGDVIAFERGASVVTHRVVENRTDEREYVTKGDANDVEDIQPIPYEALIGRVVLYVPVIGRILMTFSTLEGKIAALCVAFGGLLLSTASDRALSAMRKSKQSSGKHAAHASGTTSNRSAASPVRRIIALVAGLVFITSAAALGWTAWRYAMDRSHNTDAASRYTADADGECPKKVDFAALLAVNPDIVGWIYCKDTQIDFPVLHGEDNDYYLHHTYDGEWTYSGSIFVDARNRRGFVDANTIVYGHSMLDGSMFACLEDWKDQKYYDKHPTMWMLTPEVNYRMDLIAGLTVEAGDETYVIYHTVEEGLMPYLEKAVANSDFKTNVALDPGLHYVVLSTCAGGSTRYVMFAKLVPVPLS